jgi:hypothetical protein
VSFCDAASHGISGPLHLSTLVLSLLAERGQQHDAPAGDAGIRS